MAQEAICKQISDAIAKHDGPVKVRYVPGGETYPAAIAFDLITGAGYRRMHLPLGGVQ